MAKNRLSGRSSLPYLEIYDGTGKLASKVEGANVKKLESAVRAALTSLPVGGKKAAIAQDRRGSFWSAEEQSGAAGATQDVKSELQQANENYERRFGFIFIICATGKTAEEILEPTGRGNYELRSFECCDLLTFGGAANHQSPLAQLSAAQLIELLFHLNCQFPSWD